MKHRAFIKKCLQTAGFTDKEIEALNVEQKTDSEIVSLIMTKVPKHMEEKKPLFWGEALTKIFKVSYELIAEDPDFTSKDIEADLERFKHTNQVEIRNIKIRKERKIPRRPLLHI